MPTRRIMNDVKIPEPCRHSDHQPPSMQVFPPGCYEHECPACKKKTLFRVNAIRM